MGGGAAKAIALAAIILFLFLPWAGALSQSDSYKSEGHLTCYGQEDPPAVWFDASSSGKAAINLSVDSSGSGGGSGGSQAFSAANSDVRVVKKSYDVLPQFFATPVAFFSGTSNSYANPLSTVTTTETKTINGISRTTTTTSGGGSSVSYDASNSLQSAHVTMVRKSKSFEDDSYAPANGNGGSGAGYSTHLNGSGLAATIGSGGRLYVGSDVTGGGETDYQYCGYASGSSADAWFTSQGPNPLVWSYGNSGEGQGSEQTISGVGPNDTTQVPIYPVALLKVDGVVQYSVVATCGSTLYYRTSSGGLSIGTSSNAGSGVGSSRTWPGDAGSESWGYASTVEIDPLNSSHPEWYPKIIRDRGATYWNSNFGSGPAPSSAGIAARKAAIDSYLAQGKLVTVETYSPVSSPRGFVFPETDKPELFRGCPVSNPECYSLVDRLLDWTREIYIDFSYSCTQVYAPPFCSANPNDPSCQPVPSPIPCDPTSDPTCNPACNPATDPSCNITCNPSTDPSCGIICDPATDPNCVPPPCNPTFNPSCSINCDPMTDPYCRVVCDPATDPYCQPPPCDPATDPSCEVTCDPAIDPNCGVCDASTDPKCPPPPSCGIPDTPACPPPQNFWCTVTGAPNPASTAPASVRWTITTGGGSGNPTYYWQGSNGVYEKTTTNYIDKAYNSDGQHFMKAKAYSGDAEAICDSVVTVEAPLTVSCEASPNPALVANNDQTNDVLWQALPKGGSGDYHIHADFKVVLDGKTVDFNRAEYMETPYNALSEKGHLHGFNPSVLHIEEKGGTFKDFFESIGMRLDSACFYDGSGYFCAGNGKRLAMYVNGAQNTEFEKYEPKDLDRILIYYGNGVPAPQALDGITSQACIYSKKCPAPEGFVFPEENCTATEPCRLDENA